MAGHSRDSILPGTNWHSQGPPLPPQLQQQQQQHLHSHQLQQKLQHQNANMTAGAAAALASRRMSLRMPVPRPPPDSQSCELGPGLRLRELARRGDFDAWITRFKQVMRGARQRFRDYQFESQMKQESLEMHIVQRQKELRENAETYEQLQRQHAIAQAEVVATEAELAALTAESEDAERRAKDAEEEAARITQQAEAAQAEQSSFEKHQQSLQRTLRTELAAYEHILGVRFEITDKNKLTLFATPSPPLKETTEAASDALNVTTVTSAANGTSSSATSITTTSSLNPLRTGYVSQEKLPWICLLVDFETLHISLFATSPATMDVTKEFSEYEVTRDPFFLIRRLMAAINRTREVSAVRSPVSSALSRVIEL